VRPCELQQWLGNREERHKKKASNARCQRFWNVPLVIHLLACACERSSARALARGCVFVLALVCVRVLLRQMIDSTDGVRLRALLHAHEVNGHASMRPSRASSLQCLP